MIKRLKYHEIDFEKYTQCLENSEQRKYSATKDFLDITGNKSWELLVYKDYEAIMPIPFVKKYGIRIVLNPLLCQQLGIFSRKDFVEINDAFKTFLEKKYLIKVYAFNDGNSFSLNNKQRKNYIIFPNNYEIVYSKYSPKRKRKLRSEEAILADSDIELIDFKQAESFIKNNFLGAEKESDILKFLEIFENLYIANIVIFKAYFYQNKIVNIIAVYEDEKTNALLGTFNDKNFVKISGASILIDEMIKGNIETKIFDFEGSELPNVEEFFRGFRPDLKPFSIIDNSNKELLKSIFSLKLFQKFIF